jgi:hypothetical protein
MYGVNFAQDFVEAVRSGSRRPMASLGQEPDREVFLGVFFDTNQCTPKPGRKESERHVLEQFSKIILGNSPSCISDFL